MPELNDDILDALLQRQLSGELNPQVGRAEVAFREHLQPSRLSLGATQVVSPAPLELKPRPQRPPHRWRDGLGGRMVLLGGTALAASIAAMLIAPLLFTRMAGTTPTPAHPGSVVTPQMVSQPMVHMVHSRTYDEGTTVVGNDDHVVPARKIRQVRIDQTQYYDPEHKAHIEVTAPTEDVRFMEVDTY